MPFAYICIGTLYVGRVIVFMYQNWLLKQKITCGNIINILPLDGGVRIDKHMREKIITRDNVEVDNFFIECVNHPNNFIQGQYASLY